MKQEQVKFIRRTSKTNLLDSRIYFDRWEAVFLLDLKGNCLFKRPDSALILDLIFCRLTHRFVCWFLIGLGKTCPSNKNFRDNLR